MRLRGTLIAVLSLAALSPNAAAAQLFAAVLPSSRAVQVGTPATVFVTVVNAGASTAHGCGLTLPPGLPASSTYQTTDAATNHPTGTADSPVDIPAGAAQSFVFAVTPNAVFEVDVALTIECADAGPAPALQGLNTLHLVASASPVPDVIAVAVTPTHDGIVRSGGAFAVSAMNIGSWVGGTMVSCSFIRVTAERDIGSATICRTDPTTGACTTAPVASLDTLLGRNGVETYSIFVDDIPVAFDPASNRVRVRFAEWARVDFSAIFHCPFPSVPPTLRGERGSTSVAVGP